jgi:AcrR family transcriptional regulator
MAVTSPVDGVVIDARVRRTRQRLETAIVELCLETDLNDLTIEEIIRRADVSRPAFYSHYPDKQALLDASLEHALGALRADTTGLRRRLGTLVTGPTEALFESAGRHAPAMKVLLSGAGDGRPLRRAIEWAADAVMPALLEQAHEAGTEPQLPVELIARHWANSFFMVVEWWLVEHPELEPAVAANHFLNLTLRGRAWALGFDVAQHEIAKDKLAAGSGEDQS